MPDGETWMIPTKEGTLRPATQEETLMLKEDRIHRDQFNRDTPHPHQEGWNQAMVDYGNPTALDKLLGPHQGPGGSLRHMNDEDRKNLLIKGTKV